jgi:exodeoxyribonuclease VII small subunit
MSKSRQLTYSQALTELEEIVAKIESEEIDIDVLADKVKRAAYLIQFCRGKLRGTEEDVKKSLSELKESSDPSEVTDSVSEPEI